MLQKNNLNSFEIDSNSTKFLNRQIIINKVIKNFQIDLEYETFCFISQTVPKLILFLFENVMEYEMLPKKTLIVSQSTHNHQSKVLREFHSSNSSKIEFIPINLKNKHYGTY